MTRASTSPTATAPSAGSTSPPSSLLETGVDKGCLMCSPRGYGWVACGWLGAWGRTRSGCFGYGGQRRDSHRGSFVGRPLTVWIGVVGLSGCRSSTARACAACSEVTFSRTASWPAVIGVPWLVRYSVATWAARVSRSGATGRVSWAACDAVTGVSVVAGAGLAAVGVGLPARVRVGRVPAAATTAGVAGVLVGWGWVIRVATMAGVGTTGAGRAAGLSTGDGAEAGAGTGVGCVGTVSTGDGVGATRPLGTAAGTATDIGLANTACGSLTLRPERDSSSTTSSSANAGQPATIRAPRLGSAAAMFAATLAVMPAANATRADQRTARPDRLSSTIATLATTIRPSTDSGSRYATSGRSP